jgi:hypothetical protein
MGFLGQEANDRFIYHPKFKESGASVMVRSKMQPRGDVRPTVMV